MSKTLLLVLLTALMSACGAAPAPTLVFRPVVAEALRELERALPEAPAPAPTDADFAARVRGRAESLAADTGAMRPMLALSVHDFGDAAAPVLAQLLGESNVARDVRLSAIEMLAVLDSPVAAEVLVYHATSNPVSWIRAQCVWRLASTTQDQCVPKLLQAVAMERDSETRVYLSATLAHFGCPAFGANDAVAAPSKRFERVFWQHLWTLRGSHPEEARTSWMDVLGQLPTSFARPLAEALVDEDAAVRSVAARALAVMGPRASVAGPALLASLLGDPTIEAEALTALGAVHHTVALPEVEKRLLDRARSIPVRAAAARALGRLDATRAIEPLMSVHGVHEPIALRLAAAGALCSLGRADVGFTTMVEGLRGEHARATAGDVERWLAGLDRTGNEAAHRIRARCAATPCTPDELADLVTASRAELVR